MDESTKSSPCKECKVGDGALELQAEADHLRQHLAERDAHIVALEGEFLRCSAKATELEEQVSTWKEKYERLYDSHKRVQKLNQILEDKLLQMVDKMKGDKGQLTKDIATLSVRLAESKHNVSMLQKENERYKNDMNLAIQLLQCKPDNFVSQKLDNLPVDTQARVSQYVMSKTKATSSSQSKNGNDNETFDTNEYEFNISASLMSKILEDSIQDTVTKHCDTCTCSKTQNKPFSYDETHYSVSSQTLVSGEMNNSFCLNCNSEIKSAHSNISIRSASPHAVKLINDKAIIVPVTTSTYLVPQSTQFVVDKPPIAPEEFVEPVYQSNPTFIEKVQVQSDVKVQLETENHCDNSVMKINEEFRQLRRNIGMEPGVHHKLCERKRNSISSNKDGDINAVNEDLLTTDCTIKDFKPKVENNIENISVRKNSQGSMGAISRTSSVAKSSSSTHKSNTQVGPGPRFCSLRVQAGSKNILLDNAQPDVPPVLYKRQSKCNDNTIYKDITEGLDNFLDLDKAAMDNATRNNSIVVESTLIDVHVENNNKDNASAKANSLNHVLMNVSSSPLQPLKTHSYSNGSEKNNNSLQNNGSLKSIPNNVNTLFNNIDMNNRNNTVNADKSACNMDMQSETPKLDNQDVQIFNFDRYEQNKMANQYTRSLRKIDMSQLHTIENTKISKDLSPHGDFPKIPKKFNSQKHLPAVVNVYPNLTQTHLKVNEHKNVFTNEQSTSSLSSDDSAAILQKQQLLRVAEWVEQNLEQQNNLNDSLSLEDDLPLNKGLRRDSKINHLTDTLELALKMPHPVSKYSKSFSRDEASSWFIHNANIHHKTDRQSNTLPNTKDAILNNVAKETMFPANNLEANVTTEVKTETISKGAEIYGEVESKVIESGGLDGNAENDLKDITTPIDDKDITPEDLARMEYNVKKFLLSGPHWGNTPAVGRSRRTSSKTETDV